MVSVLRALCAPVTSVRSVGQLTDSWWWWWWWAVCLYPVAVVVVVVVVVWVGRWG